jgi:uncharacterized protein YbjT (DUF2867 family)
VILVVGSTGRLGSVIVRRLCQEGLAVRALVRRTSNVAVLEHSGAEFIEGDLRDVESLRKACYGCRAVVTTATSLRRGFDLEHIDREGNLNLIRAAMRERVGHFVFTSTIGADAPDAPRIFKNKKVIEDRLALSGLRYTILRPAGFMENLIPLIRLARRAGWAVIPGQGTTKTSYIAIRDIAEMVWLVLARPPVDHATIEFGGEDLSLQDCVAHLQEVLGRRLRILRVSLGLLRFIGRSVRPFNAAADAMLEIVEFVERKGLRADKRFLATYPIPLTSFRDFVRQQVGQAAASVGQTSRR